MKKRILHVTSGLRTGGAELKLRRLIASLNTEEFEHKIISLGGETELSAELESTGVPVLSLDLSPRNPFSLISGALKAQVELDRFRPQIVQGWMYHGNLLATLVVKPVGALMWQIHHSLDAPELDKPMTRFVIRQLSHLSQIPKKIVYCAESIRVQHEALGYAKSRALVIQNGYPATEFHADQAGRAEGRRALGIGEEIFAVAFIARYHRVKGIEVLLDTIAKLREKVPSALFVMAGKGLSTDNTELRSAISERRITENVLLLGIRNDIPKLLQSLDAFILTSHGEAFPNALAEAMLSELPCVSTDVGDVRALLGLDTWLAQAGDSDTLARLMHDLASSSKERLRELGAANRRRVIEHFSLAEYVSAHEHLYRAFGRAN